MRITYDANKRLKTLKERNLDFEHAPQVFAGVHYTDLDDRHDYGEDREITVGILKEDVVVVVWTERDQCRRIISMRKAHDKEREQYHEYLDRSG